MRQIFLVLCIFTLSISMFSSTVWGSNLELNQKNYVFGDVIIISGKVNLVEGKFIGLQILNPSKSDIVMIDQFFPKSDGSFSTSYKAQGPKWYENGIYMIKLVYDGETLEKSFEFKKSEMPKNEKPVKSDPNSENDKPLPNIPRPESNQSDPKFRVPGFPDPLNSPSYYFERYTTEENYRQWFDTTFPEHSLIEVVGYKKTHIDGFPDENNSPWYYVDRYLNEEIYKDWFDYQFPTKSIYDVLGYPESFFQKVPDWIKNNAKWWSSGLITDSDFLSGITYLINEGILVIPNLPDSGNSYSQSIPVWVKDTAGWWAEGKIDENEFLKGIQFLVENGIIQV